MAPSPLKIRTKIAVAILRIFSLPSVSQTEFNAHARRKVHWLTFASCRLELDVLRCASCCFIEPMAQTAYNPVHLHAAVREEYHLENNVAFNSQSTPFRGVLRTRFFQYVNRRRGTVAGRRFLFRRLGRDRLIREAGVCHCAANSFIATSAVAVSRSTRQCGRAKTIYIRGFVRITLTGDSVGITEAAGLHFVHRGHDGCRSCAAGSKIADFHIFFRPLRLTRRCIDFNLLESRIELNWLGLQSFNFGWFDLCREKNVRLFWVQLHRFWHHRLWFRRHDFGLHLRRWS